MSKYLDWLIVELECHGKERLSDGDSKELVAEVKAHIEEGIRARVDLGLSPEEAEKEAVESFGDPENIVKEVARSGRKKSGFIYEQGVTASGGPVLILGLGSIRVKGFTSMERPDGL